MARWIAGLAGCLLLLNSGCDALIGILEPNNISVTLVNSTSFDVDVELYYSDVQEIPELLLTTVGTKMELTLAPGDRISFSRDCDELQALIIDRAELQTIGGGDDQTGVLRDGDEFDCGDRITFTFRSILLTDLRIETNVSVVPF
ncbi:MAG: hypothetical protein J5J06_05310 [Phycisphaerae bacterium]|nr:hypothetical protein [Phycisphaerae bacterium]